MAHSMLQIMSSRCSISYIPDMTEETLLSILKGEIPPDNWLSHMDAFFNESPGPFIERFLEETGLFFADIEAVYHKLPEACKGSSFEKFMENYHAGRKLEEPF